MSTHPNKHIVLIGAGNLASQLGITLFEQGYQIKQVYSRTKKSASALAKKLKAEAIMDLKNLDLTGDIYIIAVKDDAIEQVAKQLKLKDKIVIHTSGSTSIDSLRNISKNYGVLYPLQTFSKDKKVDFKNIPICIEANNKTTENNLLQFAKSISSNVHKVNSHQREIIHLAAVFACNFSNHMYTIAEAILKENELNTKILNSLIEETANKIKTNSPVKMQTGPAVRNDKKTMNGHIKLLSGKKEYKHLYQLISKSIQEH